MRRVVSNPLALAVMSYLTMKPMHPYEVVRTLKDHDDARSVKFTPASVYMVIEQLSKAGFVEEVETSRNGAYPERTTYALTDAGRAEWHDWLRTLVADPQLERPQFVLALSLLAGLGPAEAAALLSERLDRLTALREETQGAVDQATAGGLHPLFLADENYRIALLDAEIGFVRDLTATIGDPGAGWADGAAWAGLDAAATAGEPG